MAVVVEGVTETNLGWEARKWKGHEEGVGRVEGPVVSWTRGGRALQGPANYFSAAILHSNEDASLRSTQPGRTISCHLADERYLPRARGSASHGRGASKWKYLATIDLRLPPRRVSSRPRTRRGISLRTIYQLAVAILS